MKRKQNSHSLTHTPPIQKSRNRLPRSSKSNRSHNPCGFYYWKNRDLGSIFNHEIRTSEVAGVLFTTTSGNPIPLRTLPHTKKQEQTSRSSKSNRSHNSCGFYYWKNRDLGSIFSHEIRTSEAAGVLFTTTSGSLFLRLQFHKNNLQIITQRRTWRHWEIHRQFLLMC